ncbi:thiol-disulfide oxidoreductase DCC family protein [Salinisphaera sp. T31B1]|uniref:thiol-disulfide oxidoreductase DCC family protein n=1 Tax=Salinisphaera sp. T31B1 TaxID=727963 RepID=UPI0033414DD0
MPEPVYDPYHLPPGLAPGDRVILFDGVCRLCNGWARLIIRGDTSRRFRLAAVQSHTGQALLRHFDKPTDRFDTILLIEDGCAFEKTDAALRIMRRLGWPWRAFGVLRIVPRRLRDALYDGVARHRYRLFGRYAACRRLEADHDDRFVDSEPR